MNESTINMHEAKTHLSRLADRAHGGEEIILSKAGKPWARLMPLRPGEAQEPIQVQVLTEPDWFAPSTEEDIQEMFGKDNAELFT